MRIDSHQHFWRYDPEAYDWIDASMVPLQRDFLPHDLVPLIEEVGVEGTVAVQAVQTTKETDFLLGLAEKSPFIRGVVGWVDLRGAALEKELERLAGQTKLRGFRHVVQSEPDDRFLMREDFLKGVRRLDPERWTYDILIYERQLPAAIEFARALPRHRLVLDHMGKPRIAARELEPWAGRVRELARCPHVFCKVSGMVTEAEWKGWTPDDLRPYLDVVFEAFGPERLMVGSDWPVCTLAASFDQVMRLVRDYVKPLSEAEKVAVLGRTAARFYHLGD